MRKTGTYQTLGNLNFFIPYPLPPSDPALELSPKIMSLYGEASFALGQLNEMSLRLPNSKAFIKAYVIKEALLSSAIEGIHTTLIEVFTCPLNESKPNKDTQLVLNYTSALDSALTMLQNENFPIVERVILRAHEILMSSGDGDKSSPGSYRKQPVKVGEFTPPPSTDVISLMSSLEKYINEESALPPLIRAGLVHVHFETIHPFLDGNGRIGRLLIVLMLITSGLLSSPILYPSYYFKKRHMEYYQKLDGVSSKGDFEGWILYYLTVMKDSALDSLKRAKEIEALDRKLKTLLLNSPKFSRIKETASIVLDCLFSNPITDIKQISQTVYKAYNTIDSILKKFVELEFVTENIIHKRNKQYSFTPYIKLLEKEYDV